MTKSLLALGAACIALSGMASASAPALQPSHQSCLESKGFGRLRVDGPASSAAQLPSKVASAEDIISSVDGERQDMTITGSGFYMYWGVIFDYYENDAVPSHVVYGENNEVYVYDIIPHFGGDYYLKGVKDGDKVKFDLPQTIYYDDDLMETFGVTLFAPYTYINEEGGESESYAPVEGPTSVTFTIGENGVWTSDEISHGSLIGVGSCDAGYKWNGYGAIDLSIAPFTDALVSVPEGVEVADNYWVYDAGNFGKTENWAVGSGEVYIQGLSQYLPEAWIKGSVEYGDGTAVISIPQNQYLGTVGSGYVYTKCATVGEDEYGMPTYILQPESVDFQLLWDLGKNTLVSMNPEVSLLVNLGKDELFYLEEFMNLRLFHQDSFAGTPANPCDLSYYDGVADGNWGYFNFQVPAMSTDGRYLKTDDLYYIVYIDDEEWEFDANEYDIPESLVEVPWGFDDYYISKWPMANREINFFMTGISTIGVQSVYKYNGEETRSEIVTLDLEDDPVAVDAIVSDRKVSEVKYFDLSGRQLAAPAPGILLKQVAYTDGTTHTLKTTGK